MKRLLAAVCLIAVFGSSSFSQGSATGNAIEQTFVDGGTIRLSLSSGDYTLRAASGNSVVVKWEAENVSYEKDMKRVKVRLDVHGNAAAIETDGPTKHARITIELPARSNLYLRLRAGDVKIAGIEGNKDIRMTAGDLTIDMLPSSYASVHASVKIGDLHAKPLGLSKDGFGNSIDWGGSGKYTLYASLFVGDLKLSQAARP